MNARVLFLVAIVTTPLAAPIFHWVYGRHARKSGELAAAAARI